MIASGRATLNTIAWAQPRLADAEGNLLPIGFRPSPSSTEIVICLIQNMWVEPRHEDQGAVGVDLNLVNEFLT